MDKRTETPEHVISELRAMTPGNVGFVVGCTAATGMIGFATAGLALLSAWIILGGAFVIGIVGLVAAGIAGWKLPSENNTVHGRVVVVSRRWNFGDPDTDRDVDHQRTLEDS